MSRKKYFFLVYPESGYLRSLLDCIRLIVDPAQSNYAHITLKGPYNRRVEKVLQRDNKLIAGKWLQIRGAGHFFNEKQSTVFLSCARTSELENIWKSKRKKSFKQFNPHLTIYDGNDRGFAERLLVVLSKFDLTFDFQIKSLTLYESKSSKSSLFNLQSEINSINISELIEFDLEKKNLFHLDNDKRLELVEKLCVRLSQITTKEVSGST